MKITVNGRQRETQTATLGELRRELGREGQDIAIVNGFQIGDEALLSSGDTVAFIQRGVMPPIEELESLMMARHTPKVHQKVKKARVAIAGLGGLGSNIAVMLARTGVGRLLLVDFDRVEPSNLNRQSYYIRHLGMLKTDALKEQLFEINPYIQIETQAVRINTSNAAQLFAGCDVICEAFDNPESKAMLAETVLTRLPGVKLVAASGMAGYESANLIVTRKAAKNFYLCGDSESEARPGRGLMAPRVQVCAGHQANMALRLLLGLEEP